MKALEISFDSYLADGAERSGRLYHWLPISRSLNPRQKREDYLKWAVSLRKAIFGVLLRHYDVVVIPAIHVRNRGDFPLPIKVAKKLFEVFAKLPFLPWLLSRILRLFCPVWVVFDIHYGNHLSEEVLSIVQPEAYFKRNLNPGWRSQKRSCFRMLPMPIPSDSLSGLDGVEKTREMFIAGTYETPLRLKMLEFAKQLSLSGIDVDILTERVSGEEFAQRMASAKICFASQGVGFHTWRMYEAALCGAVVLVNEPEVPIEHHWVDGENCLMHGEDLDGLPEKIRLLLADLAKTQSVAVAGKQMAEEHHVLANVSDYLWDELQRLQSR